MNMPEGKGYARPMSASTDAARADVYDLYQRAVQNADHEAWMLDRVYVDAYGSSPRVLREDFCGTAAVCHAWVRGDPTREAYGVDLDPEPLAWAWKHNNPGLNEQERRRLVLLQDDARSTGNTPPADVLAAENYSFFVFKERAQLRAYFESAYMNLGQRGVFLMDVKGGPEVITSGHRHSREIGGPSYEWEVAHFDALTHEGTYRIHFHFPDGSALSPAFEYRWRIWMPPELKDLVLEAGFTRTVFYVGRESEDGLEFVEDRHAPVQPRVLAYLAAIK